MLGHGRLVFIGIDVGTSGARAIAAGVKGTVLAESAYPIRSLRSPDGLTHEQNPAEWWEVVCLSVQQTLAKLRLQMPSFEVGGIAITSTSGTLVLADKLGKPLRPAILYDDNRSADLAGQLNARAAPGMILLNASHSLTKAAWVREREPVIWEQVRYVLHPADWLTGQLTGEFGVSDNSNVLKLGYQVEYGQWNEAVSLAGVEREKLPRVFSPGKPVNTVCPKASAESGLPVGSSVLAGATDGMASLIASGASQLGHANTTLGTTLVWKVIAERKPTASRGVYCHLHPCGDWAPGAASNTGPGSLRSEDYSLPLAEMENLARQYLPTEVVCYLLTGRGERFPFSNKTAESFLEGIPKGHGDRYAAQLQAIGFVERWGYEILQECGVTVGDMVYSTGGAATSPVLSQLRADILNRTVGRCQHPNAAFGASILAAGGTFFSGDFRSAIKTMTSLAESYSPAADLARRYQDIYGFFRQSCARRGYE